MSIEVDWKVCFHKGRPPKKKNVYFRALPKLALPPPTPPNSGNLVLFFRTSKTTYCAYDRKSIDDDDDGWNHDYDGDDDNIDAIDDKNDQKHTNIMTFE